MDVWSWVVLATGAVLVLAVLLDAFLTVLHIDHDGPLASATLQGTWRAAGWLARAFPRARREILPLAGPVMLVLAFAVWLVSFIVGFALVYWPLLAGFQADEGLSPLGFPDALYLSGVTGATLGYGDLTPVTPVLQVLTIVQAGTGFALITAIISYLVSVTSGATQRHSLALRMRIETEGTGDGTVAVVRSLRAEGSEALRDRLQLLVLQAQSLQQKMYQFPVLDLFYRMRDPAFAPEVMLNSLAGAALAAEVAAQGSRARSLGPVAAELAETATDAMRFIARQHLCGGAVARLLNAEPGERDVEWVSGVRSALLAGVPGLFDGQPEEPPSPLALQTACTTRVFLEEVDRLTGWSRDEEARARGRR